MYDRGWSIEEAHVVCRQLGYPRATAHFINAHFGQGSGPIWQNQGVYCPTGNENSLLECYRLPWGCNCQGCSTRYHRDDVGVRCEGEKNVTAIAERYAESRRELGLAYGFTESVYYDLRSELTFTSSSVNNGDVLQCHVLGLVRSARLKLSDGAQPSAGILSIETTEIRGKDNVVSLFIVCHVNVTAQPSPPIHSYTISADNVNISSSSSAYTLFAPRPNKCINVTCSGTNGHGATSARVEYCPKDRPSPGIISIDYQTLELEDQTILNITCRVNPADQPFPPIHTFTITADDDVISSDAPSATFEPSPTTCIDVSCMALNDYGETFKRDSYCPPDSGSEPRPPADNILTIETHEIRGEGNQVTLIINCHVALADQPYPHLHTYEIIADNITLSNSSCASGILRNRPDRCINITCFGTNGLGPTSTHVTHCPTRRIKVRLVGGPNEKEGRVEIFCDGLWGTMCDYGLDLKEAHAVCRQLGYPRASAYFTNAHFGQGSGPIWLDHGVYCPTGNENSLLECFRLPWGCYHSAWSSCGHDDDVGVRCEGERNETAVAERYAIGYRNAGVSYGFTNYIYYDMRSEFTFTPTGSNGGDILQCHVLGVVKSVTLQISGE
ncbi:uncharacterized protein [Diadema setosum]|uniref:uncharacterized protein n=1 Tax=Diadema setosum TaxID=31175 RepID=UPI003B3B402A